MPAPKPPRADAVDGEIRQLYQGPLEAFTAARDALARRLKADGDTRHAEVKALRKPSLSAWAVNRLLVEEERGMKALVAAGEAARAAQPRAAAGEDAGPLRRALQTIREESARLLAAGTALLAAGGKPAGETVVDRLRADLDALALVPGAAPLAARGWLDEDLAPPDFTIVAALQVAAAGERPARGATTTRPPAAAKPVASVHSFAAGKQALAARRAREAREKLERSRAALARAEAEATARRDEAARAGEAAERTAREALEAQERALAARKAAHEAAGAANVAEAALRRAREQAAEAERESAALAPEP